MAEAAFLSEEGWRSSTYPAREAAIAELFGRQKAVATLEQLCRLGLSRRAVQQRAQLHRLYRVYPAVYTTTPPPLLPAKARWLAAVLACGPEALLSHRTAAALHGIRPTTRSGIDVTSPTARGRRLAGIDAHRVTTLAPQDITTRDGIPCTSLARTFIDFAPLVPLRGVERAIDQSEMLEIFDLQAFNDVLARNPTFPAPPSSGPCSRSISAPRPTSAP